MTTASHSSAPETAQPLPSATDKRETDNLYFRDSLGETVRQSDIVSAITIARLQRHEVRDLKQYNEDPTHNPGPETIQGFTGAFDCVTRAKCRGIQLCDKISKPPRTPAAPKPRREKPAPTPYPAQDSTPSPAGAPDCEPTRIPPAGDTPAGHQVDALVDELRARLEGIESIKCFEGRTYGDIFNDIMRALGFFDVPPYHPWRRRLLFDVAHIESRAEDVADRVRNRPKSTRRPVVTTPYDEANLNKMPDLEMEWRLVIEDSMDLVDQMILVRPKPKQTAPPDQ